MADLVSDLITYDDYLSITGQVAADVPERSLKLLSLEPLVKKRVGCVTSTAIGSLSEDQLAVLKSWVILYINRNLELLDPNASGLVEIDDGYVKEKYDPAVAAMILAQLDQKLNDQWLLFKSLFTVTEVSQPVGLGVVDRSSRRLFSVNPTTENTE